MKKQLLVALVVVLLVQATLAKSKKKKDSSSSSDSSDSSEKKHSKNCPKCPTCPPERVCRPCPPQQVLVIREVTACRDDQKRLSCPQGSGIQIHEAFYGRKNPNTCPYLGQDESVHQTCSSSSVLQDVRNRCTGRRDCDISSASSWLGDPCRGTNKYLEVSFSCAST
ncbi:D-galactoside-specific lectin [Halyomorpha halys]|uniref:D-galactoside-specific lectin n=1 Tax=Halyomorpha halys TaxID=286706 RepID=UPI0006D4E57B|nr:D-galactoside-specific lectin-like [Halyomorpha halys]